MPIAISISPAMSSILFSKKCPMRFPSSQPSKDRKKVTTPMIITAAKILSVISERVMPTAKASILVAIDKLNRTRTLAGSGRAAICYI